MPENDYHAPDRSGWGAKEYHVLEELKRLGLSIDSHVRDFKTFSDGYEDDKLENAIAMTKLTERAKIWGGIAGFAATIIATLVKELVTRHVN